MNYNWLGDWWVTMRVTIILLLLAVPLAIIAVIMLPSDSPFSLLGATYSMVAMAVGFVADNFRLTRRKRQHHE